MSQNKLKKKVEALTNVVRELIKELQNTTSLAQGTLTAFQMHIGKDDWEKIVNELKEVEERKIEQKKFETNVE
jgi:hypothetical protein